MVSNGRYTWLNLVDSCWKRLESENPKLLIKFINCLFRQDGRCVQSVHLELQVQLPLDLEVGMKVHSGERSPNDYVMFADKRNESFPVFHTVGNTANA